MSQHDEDEDAEDFVPKKKAAPTKSGETLKARMHRDCADAIKHLNDRRSMMITELDTIETGLALQMKRQRELTATSDEDLQRFAALLR